MQELKRALIEEQPHINIALERHVADMPPSARPVAEHVFSAGGKRLRPFLTLMTGRALGCSKNDLYSLGAAVEMLHAATLLHDDILDNAILRRGRPAAHTVFAETRVILAGDALLARAMLLVSSFGDTRLTDCISMAVMRTAEGEIAEFEGLRNLDAPHDDYLAMVTGKTAWMLRASCELGALFANVPQRLIDAAASFGLELGIAFQMVDDALDVFPASVTGKPRGGDIREGKVTPPLRLYMDSLDSQKAADLRDRFQSGSMSDNDIDIISEAVYAGGFAEKTRNMAEEHLARAGAALCEFPCTAERLVLEQMLVYIAKRER